MIPILTSAASAANKDKTISNMNIKRYIHSLAAVLTVLALTLALHTSCSNEESVLPGAGGTELNIRVAPKPGFTDGSAIPGTRSTVGDDGSFSWSTGDRIYLHLTFNDTPATKQGYTLVYDGSAWETFEGLLPSDDTAATPAAIKWPLGNATQARVNAFYTDCKTTVSGNEIYPDYSTGTGDVMIVNVLSINIGDDITLAPEHTACRFFFPGGLEAGAKYSLAESGSPYRFYRYYNVEYTTVDNLPETPQFTAAADGSLVVCGKYILSMDPLPIALKKVSDGTVVYSAEIDLVKGTMYTCTLPSAGGIDPDNRPDLLTPRPIVPGNKVYEVNGYYVTAPDADIYKEYQWATSLSATQMDNDPCAGRGNWRMPTMTDFEKILGWSITNPWSQNGASGAEVAITSDTDAWKAAFPYGDFLSSVAHASNSSYVWCIGTNGYGKASYNSGSKTGRYVVRCVQKQ